MRKIISASIMLTQLTGCFSHVIDVSQVLSSKVAILNSKYVEMPKPGCYIDTGHGRFCTGSEYSLNNSNQWSFDKDIPGTIKTEHVTYVIPQSQIDWQSVGKAMGSLALLGVIGASVYLAGRRNTPDQTYLDQSYLINEPKKNSKAMQEQSVQQPTLFSNSPVIPPINFSKQNDFTNEMPISRDITIKDLSNGNKYRGEVDSSGDFAVKDMGGNRFKGNVDQDGYGYLKTPEGNRLRLRP